MIVGAGLPRPYIALKETISNMRLKKISLLILLLFFVLACQAVTGSSVQTAPTQQADALFPTSLPATPEITPTEEGLTELGYGAKDVSPAPEKFALVKIVGNGVSLDEILYAEAQKAVALGLNPFVDFSADWCPPCIAIEESMDDPKMIDAFTGTYIIQLNYDEWERQISDYGFYVVGIPTYYEVDAEGFSTGRLITGGAWGADTAESMAPPMKAFFAGE